MAPKKCYINPRKVWQKSHYYQSIFKKKQKTSFSNIAYFFFNLDLLYTSFFKANVTKDFKSFGGKGVVEPSYKQYKWRWLFWNVRKCLLYFLKLLEEYPIFFTEVANEDFYNRQGIFSKPFVQVSIKRLFIPTWGRKLQNVTFDWTWLNLYYFI